MKSWERMKKLLLMLAVVFYVVSSSVISYGAVDVTLLNNTFVRGTGNPIIESFNFAGGDGPAKIIIYNGGIENSSTEKVSSSMISINEQVVFSASDFNQKVDYLEKSIQISEGENIIGVLLKGKPGGRLAIQIIQTIDAEVAEVIGPEGGVITVEDTESPLYGTRIEIPANAFNKFKIISIKDNNLSSLLPEGTIDTGPFVDFGPDGTQFNSPVYITIPYADKDNDGFIDYSDIPETDIKVVNYNETDQTWEELTILSQDIEKNLITVEDIHFSTKVSIATLNCTGPAVIFAIDGLKFKEVFSFGFWPDDLQPSYLQDAIRDMKLNNINRACVITYSGPGNSAEKRWDGNAHKTEDIMNDLKKTVKAYYDYAKNNNRKFVLVTHSWGTILGMLALKYNNDVNPDLFITLSSPYGSINAASQLVYPAEAIINTFLWDEIYETYAKCGQPARKIENFQFKWTNYWAWGDVISGPIQKLSAKDIQIDQTYNTNRNWGSGDTKRWHAITSLNKTVMHYSDFNQTYKNYADNFINKVKSEIVNSIGDGSGIMINNSNFINGGDESTTSTTVNINLTATDACGIDAYYVCGYFDMTCDPPGPCPLTPELIQCVLNKIQDHTPFIYPPVKKLVLNMPVETVYSYMRPAYGDTLGVDVCFYSACGYYACAFDSIKYTGPSLR
ncbi:MAG: hypothetical protein AB1414_13205 [bacterium]